jgi:hypothetical protein
MLERIAKTECQNLPTGLTGLCLSQLTDNGEGQAVVSLKEKNRNRNSLIRDHDLELIIEIL